MLWHKGWLETRFRLLFALGFGASYCIAIHAIKAPDGPSVGKPILGVAIMMTIAVAAFSIMLSGAGIATQPSFQATKGLHGSTLFTLSLPVSRFQLLATRACLGWLESALAIGIFCYGLWLRFPTLKSAVTGLDMIEFTGTLIASASALYFA